MICKNCGKELKEGSSFCGFCGTKVEIEEENTTPIEVVDEQVEANVEEKVEVETTQAEEKKVDFEKIGNSVKKNIDKVQWNEFSVYKNIVKGVTSDYEVSLMVNIVTLVGVFIINWVFIGTYTSALFITLVCYAALMGTYFLANREKDINKLLTVGTKNIFMPAIIVLIASILLLISGATAKTLSSLYNSLLSVYVVVIYGLILYIVNLVKIGKNVNAYVLALIVTLVICLCVYFLGGSILTGLY